MHLKFVSSTHLCFCSEKENLCTKNHSSRSIFSPFGCLQSQPVKKAKKLKIISMENEINFHGKKGKDQRSIQHLS